MTKKIFIILVFVLVLFSMQKIYAMEISDEITIQKVTQLDSILEVKNEKGEWEDLKIDKYDESNGIIYKLENSDDISSNTTISEQIQDISIITILANGYNGRNQQNLGISNASDKYIATKIALDCVEQGIDIENTEAHFRAKENLEEPIKIRANSIINAVNKLLKITKENYFNVNLIISQKGCMEKDEFNDGYSSQKYEIEIGNCSLKGYNILRYTDFPGEAFSTNNRGEKKSEFRFEEDSNTFRILTPIEYRELAFTGCFSMKIQYEKSVAYFATNGTNRYIILTDIDEEISTSVSLLNTMSSINVKVNDKDEPWKAIKDVKMKIKDENNLVDDIYTTDKYGGVFISLLGTGNVQIEVLEIPENYTLKEKLYNKNLAYYEYCEYIIGLKHKKGSLHVNTNIKDAVFQIYDKNYNYIGTYKTNDVGQIIIDEINIGEDYILKQIMVPNGYKLVEDNKFSIIYNETTNIEIINEEEIKEVPKEENKKPNDNNEESSEENGTQDDNKKPSEENKNPDDNNKTPNEDKQDEKEDNNVFFDNNNSEQKENQDVSNVGSEKETANSETNNTDLNEEKIKQDKLDSNIENEKVNNERVNTIISNEKSKDINKLPRTGYDFPEIEPMHIIFIILILLYILKRTAI